MVDPTPRVLDGALAYTDETGGHVVRVGSDDWARWLEAPGTTRFRFEEATGSFTARREHRGSGTYWYAYRKRGGRLAKAYIGPSRELDRVRLAEVAARLSQPVDE